MPDSSSTGRPPGLPAAPGQAAGQGPSSGRQPPTDDVLGTAEPAGDPRPTSASPTSASPASGPRDRSVAVEFTLTEGEFVSAQRQMMARSLLVAVASGVMLAIVIAGIATLSGYAIGIGVAWFILVAAMFYQGPKMAWRRNPAVQTSQRHTFSEEGATLTFLGRQNEVDWKYFTRVVRSSHLYQLLRGRQFGLVVPRRAFATPADEQFFMDLLQRHVRGRARSPR